MRLTLIKFGNISANGFERRLKYRGASTNVVRAECHSTKMYGRTLGASIELIVQDIIDNRLVEYSQILEQTEQQPVQSTVHALINSVRLTGCTVAKRWVQIDPTAVCFGRLPTSVEELLWYELAKSLRVPTLIFHSSPVNGRSFCVTSLDDFGQFQSHVCSNAQPIRSALRSAMTRIDRLPGNILLEIDAAYWGTRPACEAAAFDPVQTVNTIRDLFPCRVKIDVTCEIKMNDAPNDWARRAICELKNVELLSNDLARQGLWQNYDLVASVGGPIGELAAQNGMPVLTFGKPWYQILPNVNSIKDIDLTQSNFPANFYRCDFSRAELELILKQYTWPISIGAQIDKRIANHSTNLDELAKCTIQWWRANSTSALSA
jgi:hypothetical protein